MAAVAAFLAGQALSPMTTHAALAGASGRIAFESDRDGDREIFVMNADGTGQTQLTVNTRADFDRDDLPMVRKSRFQAPSAATRKSS